MRRWIVPLVVLALGAGISMPLGVWAAGSSTQARAGTSHSGLVDRQAALTVGRIVTRSTSGWVTIRELSGLVICAQNEVSVTISFAEKSGGEPEVRVLMDGTQLLDPGSVRFNYGRYDAPSFTWVGTATNTGGTDNHTITVQWRANTDIVAYNMAVENVLYENGTTC